jgi:hypothetical protein
MRRNEGHFDSEQITIARRRAQNIGEFRAAKIPLLTPPSVRTEADIALILMDDAIARAELRIKMSEKGILFAHPELVVMRRSFGRGTEKWSAFLLMDTYDLHDIGYVMQKRNEVEGNRKDRTRVAEILDGLVLHVPHQDGGFTYAGVDRSRILAAA